MQTPSAMKAKEAYGGVEEESSEKPPEQKQEVAAAMDGEDKQGGIE